VYSAPAEMSREFRSAICGVVPGALHVYRCWVELKNGELFGARSNNSCVYGVLVQRGLSYRAQSSDSVEGCRIPTLHRAMQSSDEDLSVTCYRAVLY